MLERCLASIVDQNLNGANFIVELVVVDNNSEPDARSIVQKFSAQSPFPIHYVHEPKRGIPMARNAALDKALERHADWIAFIDDDEYASRDWLMKLYGAMQKYNADVINGALTRVYPAKLPFWTVPVEPLPSKRYEGEVRPFAATANVLFSAAFVNGARARLRFNEAMRFTGGSDTEFFARMHRAGARIVNSFEPQVYEELVPSRLSLSAQILRSYRISIEKFRSYKKDRGLANLIIRFFPKALENLILGVFSIFISPVFLIFSSIKFKYWFMKGLKRVFAAFAYVMSIFSLYPNPYKHLKGYGIVPWMFLSIASNDSLAILLEAIVM